MVAIGLAAGSPYPLAGKAASVIEDIHRQGGWAVIAHPDSPKAALQFRARGVPFDGMEWINADTEWRDEAASRLLLVAARSLIRGPEAIVSLFSRPARSLERWDAASRLRSVTGLAAVDAHANISTWDADEGEPRPWIMLARPTYAQMFRAVTQAVVIDEPPAAVFQREHVRRDDGGAGGEIQIRGAQPVERSIGELAAIGRNINQIARAANKGGRLPSSGRDEFRAMLKVCEALRENTKALLKANLASWKSGYGEDV